jgi:hypothetical protein
MLDDLGDQMLGRVASPIMIMALYLVMDDTVMISGPDPVL